MNKIDHLKSCNLFKELNQTELSSLEKITSVKNLTKGNILFFEGDRADGFYLLLTGKVKIYKSSPDGKEQILHIIKPGQIFAEVAIFDKDSFPANCIAVDNSQILFFPKIEFINLIEKLPQISLKIIGSMSAFLREFTEIIENLSLKEVPSRIAAYLIKLSDNAKDQVVDLDLSKTELAKHLGTLSETLSRGFRKLMDQGIILVDGQKITILDFDKLSDIAEGEKI